MYNREHRGYKTFDIENLARDEETGKVVFAMVLEFRNSKGKRIFSEENKNIEELNALGGDTFATFVTGRVGRDTKPGTYTMRLTIKDRITEKQTVYSREFEVRKKAFGLLRIQTLAMGFVGQPFGIKFSVEGFDRDEKKKPRLTLRVRIYDDKVKDEKKAGTLVRPIEISIPKDLAEEVDAAEQTYFDLGTLIRLTRPGTFTLDMSATDRVSKKNVHILYKVTVLDPRKYESAK